ncbi:MAG: ferritin family protein [Desulfuromonadales bacterium]|nr:ferritin family protein [Desulfuromonadales bacterium]
MYGVLADCYQIEIISEKIYRKMAAKETFAPEIRQAFQLLAADEQNHASQIDLLVQSPDSKIDAVTRISGEKVAQVLALAERIMAKVENSDMSEEEALHVSVLMEQEFIKIHAHNALYFFDQRLADFFDTLGSADLIHLNRLKDLLRWWFAEGKAGSHR